MRKLLNVILALLISLGILAGTAATVEAKEGFDINKHVVEMEVHEDGSVLVTETLTVEFSSKLHGIYFDIPKKYNMRWELNGETINKSYTFPVHHVNWHGMLCLFARSRIFASATSARTSLISASSVPASIASTIDCMFEPAPDPRTPRCNLLMCELYQIQRLLRERRPYSALIGAALMQTLSKPCAPSCFGGRKSPRHRFSQRHPI